MDKVALMQVAAALTAATFTPGAMTPVSPGSAGRLSPEATERMRLVWETFRSFYFAAVAAVPLDDPTTGWPHPAFTPAPATPTSHP